jgi:hypothetical protein
VSSRRGPTRTEYAREAVVLQVSHHRNIVATS